MKYDGDTDYDDIYEDENAYEHRMHILRVSNVCVCVYGCACMPACETFKEVASATTLHRNVTLEPKRAY